MFSAGNVAVVDVKSGTLTLCSLCRQHMFSAGNVAVVGVKSGTLTLCSLCRQHMFSAGNVAVVGVKSVCLDPGLSLARPDCLVVSSRPAMKASFDAAAVQFGCEVHSYGPDQGRRLSESLSALPGGRRPVSVLALHLDGGQLADLLARPPVALRRVEQLTVRLNLTAALMSQPAGDVRLLRRLYGGLLRLQDAGFHPFSSTIAEDEDVPDITLPGQSRSISTVSEIAWMRVLCV